MNLKTLKALAAQVEGVRSLKLDSVEIYIHSEFKGESKRETVKAGKELLTTISKYGEHWHGILTESGSYKLMPLK